MKVFNDLCTLDYKRGSNEDMHVELYWNCTCTYTMADCVCHGVSIQAKHIPVFKGLFFGEGGGGGGGLQLFL